MTPSNQMRTSHIESVSVTWVMGDDEAGDVTAQKRRVRAAHWGSVTRLIGQFDEALGSADARRLKKLKQSFTGKLSILSRLDNELIELVEEEQLETEMEQAHLIEERLALL